MKTTMKLADLMRSPNYKSIINLTNYFQARENGLRLMHYRWALIKNHDNIKDEHFKKIMTDFFSGVTKEQLNEINAERKTIEMLPDELKKIAKKRHQDLINQYTLNFCYSRGDVIKDCIQGEYANHNLTNFLDKLVNQYKILRKHRDKEGIERYTISSPDKITALYNRMTIELLLERWSDEKIAELCKCGLYIEHPELKEADEILSKLKNLKKK
jgi:hypothetical protein